MSDNVYVNVACPYCKFVGTSETIEYFGELGFYDPEELSKDSDIVCEPTVITCEGCEKRFVIDVTLSAKLVTTKLVTKEECQCQK